MSERQPALRSLILKAKQGDKSALNELLDRHRRWLKVFVSERTKQKLQARFDDSDVIQDTCNSAFQRFDQFQGTTAEEFQAWLRRIHERNRLDFVRKHETAIVRSVNSEQEFDNHDNLPEENQISPSKFAIVGEDAARLADAMAALPADQQEAVRLRYAEGLSIAELAAELERSKEACCGLLKRALKSLRQELAD